MGEDSSKYVEQVVDHINRHWEMPVGLVYYIIREKGGASLRKIGIDTATDVRSILTDLANVDNFELFVHDERGLKFIVEHGDTLNQQFKEWSWDASNKMSMREHL